MALIPLRGVAYPYQKLKNGIPATAEGIEVYDCALYSLLRTNQRSRVMQPAIGTILQNLLFDTTGPFLASRIRQTIFEAVAAWIPGLSITGINVQETDTRVDVSISYSVRGQSRLLGPISYGR